MCDYEIKTFNIRKEKKTESVMNRTSFVIYFQTIKRNFIV